MTVALGIGLYFLCLFKAPCHWSISPNRGGTFLRENSNGIKVGCLFGLGMRVSKLPEHFSALEMLQAK